MKSLINLLIVFFFFQSLIYAQNFEGTIIYKVTIERPEDSPIPEEVFNNIFKEVNSTVNYYFTSNKCRVETNNADKTIFKNLSIFDFDSAKVYSYISDQDDICYYENVENSLDVSSFIKINDQDTLTINNKLCYSISFSNENSSAKYYYPIKSQIEQEDITKSSKEVFGFITKKEIFPLRIVLSGNGAGHNVVLTLDSIIKEPLNAEIFKLPEFKSYVDLNESSPSKQKTIIKNEIDTLLVGSWSGSEKNKERMGLEKHWIQIRLSDGTYTTHLTEIENNEENNYTETGNWWVENGVFYEWNSSDTEPNAYKYEIINESKVRFKLINRDDYPDYEFIDTKIEY